MSNKITLKYTPLIENIVADTAAIKTNCNVIAFENVGTVAASIQCSTSGGTNDIPAGMTKVFGDKEDAFITSDITFDITFAVAVGTKSINIVRINYNVIE